jgi:opacity protein-like surface antigen
MLNFYYDIDTGTSFTPYVGCGIGTTHRTLKASANIDSGRQGSGPSDQRIEFDAGVYNNITWQVGGGVCYFITDNLAIDIGYRYTDMRRMKELNAKAALGNPPSSRLDASLRTKPKCHEILVGLRYTF